MFLSPLIDTKAFGAENNLTTDQVKESVMQNPDLTTEERKRALARINVIRMASNRRVDITLSSHGPDRDFSASLPVQLNRRSEPDRRPRKTQEGGARQAHNQETGTEETITFHCLLLSREKRRANALRSFIALRNRPSIPG